MGKKQSKLSIDDQEHYIIVHKVENVKNPYFQFIKDIELLLEKSTHNIFGSKEELLSYLTTLMMRNRSVNTENRNQSGMQI